MQNLPVPSTQFEAKKAKIISQLAVPDADYSDASPKGSVDVGIRDLIEEINAIDGFVTTSSCAGRVSVFVEGRKTAEEGGDGQIAGVGGKGAGGAWLFVSHDPVPENDEWITALGITQGDQVQHESGSRRLIHFKFEPMILHVLTASLSHAQSILRCGLQAGFRESGAVNLLPSSSTQDQSNPVVAVRTMGLTFESLIGHQTGDQRKLIVTREYLRSLMQIANERFVENTKRIERFQQAVRDLTVTKPSKIGSDGGEWEDTAARRERKRAEGLRRKAELETNKKANSATDFVDEAMAGGLPSF